VFSPGWAAGSFFIPIVHLWKPYQAVKEIWRASEPDGTPFWKVNSRPAVFPVWWATWIIGNLLGNQAMRRFWFEKGPQQLEIASDLDAAASVFLILAAIAAVPIVRGICRRQEARHAALAATASSFTGQP